MSLARGLDYYTGVIYEAILTGEQPDVGKAAKGENQTYLLTVLGFDKLSKITRLVNLKNKQHHSKVQLNSFPMNGYGVWFGPTSPEYKTVAITFSVLILETLF